MLSLALSLALVFSPAAVTSAAQSDQKPDAREIQFPKDLNKWLAAGDHQDIPWKVRLDKPVLTFQQRQVIKATAKVDAAALQEKSATRRLLFVIKVADSSGKWFPGGNFVTQDFDQSLGHSSDVQLQSEVLLRPGKYTVATIMYDSVLGQHNISFLPVTVDPPKNDAFPELLRNIPYAEFVRGDIKGLDTFGVGKPYLPLKTRRAVQLEVLVDLSTRERQFRTAIPPTFSGTIRDLPRPPHFRRLHDQSYFTRLMQTASVLTSLEPQNGCLLVSAFDAIKETATIPPEAAGKVDWLKVRDAELGPEKDTISVTALGARKDLAQFVQKQFDELVHSPSCTAASEPVHIVVVLSHGLQLPEGNHKVRLESCGCSVLYLRQTDTAMNFDDLKGILSPLSPRELDFSTPEQFRSKLSDVIRDIEKLAQ